MNTKDQHEFFQLIVEEHQGLLFKVIRTYCDNEEDRQDLLQEILTQLWQSTQRYDQRYKISTWIYRISLNVAISFYRKNSTRARSTTVLDEQTEHIPIHDPTGEEQLKMLQEFIAELKDLDKALILLYLEDKAHAEIAEILGMSVSNVGTKVGRIKERLRTRFAQIKS